MTKAVKRIVRCPDGVSLLFACNLLLEAKPPKDKQKRRKLFADRRRAEQEYSDHVAACDGCYTEFEVTDE